MIHNFSLTTSGTKSLSKSNSGLSPPVQAIGSIACLAIIGVTSSVMEQMYCNVHSLKGHHLLVVQSCTLFSHSRFFLNIREKKYPSKKLF